MPDDLMRPPFEPVYKTYDLSLAFVALYHDYGDPGRGTSYEHDNLYLCLKELFRDSTFYDYHAVLTAHGKQRMNAALLDFIKRRRPDLTIFPLFKDEFLVEAIEELREYTKTLAYFFDDAWRIEYSNYWAPHFDYFVTASTRALRRYRMLGEGYEHAIYSPYGYNHFLMAAKELPKIYDVSFVGGSHPWRAWLVERLRKAGIPVAVWGGGLWPNGKLSHPAMVEVFNQTKINLNVSNSISWHLPYLVSSWRALHVNLTSRKTVETLKARPFEICGCGGFQLSYYAEDFERCFEIGREAAIYVDVDDLIEKIRYYLRYEDERAAIAAAGYRRARREHSYATRFTAILDRIFAGRPLSAPPIPSSGPRAATCRSAGSQLAVPRRERGR